MIKARVPFLLTIFILTCSNAVSQDRKWQEKANQMVREQIEKRGIDDESLLQVMRNTPRHRFVPAKHRDLAYTDRPLPIGYDQTISQPYVVALMTDLLDLDGDEQVLEIGTGSGYQAAILGVLADQVYTIEIIGDLADTARNRLQRMGYENVHVRHGDGYKGWPDQAPFDRIMVTAAPETIPEALKEQLKKGGRMVLPVGDYSQELKVVEKSEKGEIREREISKVRFVPMVRPQDRK